MVVGLGTGARTKANGEVPQKNYDPISRILMREGLKAKI